MVSHDQNFLNDVCTDVMHLGACVVVVWLVYDITFLQTIRSFPTTVAITVSPVCVCVCVCVWGGYVCVGVWCVCVCVCVWVGMCVWVGGVGGWVGGRCVWVW